MRREQFDLDVRNLEWVDADDEPRQPLARISVTGKTDELQSRLTAADGDRLTDEMVDVAFRLTEAVDDPEATGVVSVANRLTGDFIFETNEDAADVFRFIHAAREYGRETGSPEGRYRIEIVVDGETISFDKGTFLVYDDAGDLLRGQSLIPSGVEL